MVVLAQAISVFVPQYNFRITTLHCACALKIKNTNTDIMYKATLIHLVHGQTTSAGIALPNAIIGRNRRW
jgi:hypothetical protein